MLNDLIKARAEAWGKYEGAARESAILKAEYLSLDRVCELIAGTNQRGVRKYKKLFHAVYEKFEYRPFRFADIAALGEEFAPSSSHANLRDMLKEYLKGGYLNRPTRGRYAITEYGKIFFGIASAGEGEVSFSKSDLKVDIARLGGGIMGPGGNIKTIFAKVFKKFGSKPFEITNVREIVRDSDIEIKDKNLRCNVCGYAKQGYLNRISRGQYAMTDTGRIFFGINVYAEDVTLERVKSS